MIQRLIVLAAIAVSITGCGVFGGGTVSPNDWEVGAISPDGTQLLVATSYGAGTSCYRFEGWEVSETNERVEILAMLWNADGSGECTMAGTSSTVAVQLDVPLGAREVVGCGAEDCRPVADAPSGFRGPPVVVASDDHVAVLGDADLRLFDQEGALVSTHAPVALHVLEPVGDVLVSSERGSVAAYGHMAAETRWTVAGEMKASDDDYLYVCTLIEGRSTVSQIQASAGESLWSIEAPCDFVVPLEDTVIMLGTIPTADGELVVVDGVTGTEIARRPFDDGTDDRINGARGATRVGDHAVVFGWQSDTIVLDEAGEEVARRPDHLGVPVGATDNILITAAEQQILGTEPLTGELMWSLDRRHAGGQSRSFIVADDAVWLPDPGVVTRISATTGEVEWSTPVPLGAGTSLAVTEDVVYATAPLSLAALGSATGDELWTAELPWSGEVIEPRR